MIVGWDTVGERHAPDYRIPLSAHSPGDLRVDPGQRFHLILLEQGNALVRWDDQTVMVDAPSLLCLNETEALHTLAGNQIRVQSIVFHPRVVNQAFAFEGLRMPLAGTDLQDRDCLWIFLDREVPGRGIVDLKPTSLLRVRALFDEISLVLSAQTDSYWPCRSRSYFLELLLLIDRLAMEVAPLGAGPDAVGTLRDGEGAEVLIYVHENYQQDLSVQGLCRQFATNRTSLSAWFKTATGTSPMSYVARYRAKVAASMLRETTLPIGEVLERTGFSDPTHFGRVFRRTYGQSPSAYRRALYREGD